MFDIRRIQVHSLREFFKEFLMIVVGILTAITIEHYYTLSHKRHLAEKAAEQVHAEIRANLESVTQGIEKNQKAIATFVELEQGIVSDLESKLGREQMLASLEKRMDGHYGIGAFVIEPAQDAWDAAIASQAVVHMDASELQTFSRLYATQRAMTSDLAGYQQAMRTVTWSHWNSVITDLQFHRVDAIDFLKALREYTGNLQVLNHKMVGYRDALKKATEGHHPTTAEH